VCLAENVVVRKEALVVSVEKALIYDLVDLRDFLALLRKKIFKDVLQMGSSI